jgi:glycosyltransferase involved in cell wall biosynthesis
MTNYPVHRITIVMPRTGEWASGGMRIIYEHASRLARLGHKVTVVHPGRFVIDPTGVDHIKNAVRFLLRRIDGRFTPEQWLSVDPRVRMICVPSLAERFIPEGDIVVATAWQTAECVRTYAPKKGRPFYFIQHLETWNGPQDRVFSTWKAPLQKIVPSRWLAEIAREHGEDAIYIPHGLDVEAFQIEASREERSPGQLMMLHHNAAWKGCQDGLRAVSIVKEAIPDLRLILFGVPKCPDNLPDWIEYHQSPSPAHLRGLYNRASVFVAPSLTEGWGLTGCEALLCGAALAATDIDGHREFAFHGETALTSPPKAPEALAANVLRLVQDSGLRIRLAQQGCDFVRQLTWERASSGLESALCGRA